MSQENQAEPDIDEAMDQLIWSVISNASRKHGLDPGQARAALRRGLDRIEDRIDAKAWRGLKAPRAITSPRR